jgi:serine/threonine-protein kinase
MSTRLPTGPTTPPTTRYVLDKRIGVGGFGEVFLAKQISAGGLKQRVAIKFLHSRLDPTKQGVRRLRDEARLLAALEHPAILRVHDLLALDGRAALIAEYVHGADLSRCIEHGSMSAKAVVEVCGHIADALDAAFQSVGDDGKPLRLVHRDIKPANIRLTPHGTVKLLDFGVARAEDPEREAATNVHERLGTRPYLPPEVVTFQVDRQDERADIFALGCTLYEGLAREALFPVGVQETLHQRISSDAERFGAYLDKRQQALPSDLDPNVRALLRAMLAHAPGDRPAATNVAKRCFELAGGLAGPSLRAWCKGAPWGELHGPLTPVPEGPISLVSSPLEALSSGMSRLTDGGPPLEPSLDDGVRHPGERTPSRLVLLLTPALVVALVAGVGTWMTWPAPPAEPEQEAPADDDPIDVPAVPIDLETLDEPTMGETRPPDDAGASDIPGADPEDREDEVATTPKPVTRPPAPRTTPARTPAPLEETPPPRRPPPTGRVVVSGDVPVELRKAGSVVDGSGTLATGTWTLYAKFENTWEAQATRVHIEPGKQVTVHCSSMAWACRVSK